MVGNNNQLYLSKTNRCSRAEQHPEVCLFQASVDFGRLPDAVLLQILRDGCDTDTQQAAYRSCKAIREFCNRHMKSVTVKIFAADSLWAIRRMSSSTMCPKAAMGIERLTVIMSHVPGFVGTENAYTYLQELINNTFSSSSTHVKCRREQLANVSSITVLLPGISRQTGLRLQILYCLLIQLRNLRNLYTAISGPTFWVPVPNEQGRTEPEFLLNVSLAAMVAFQGHISSQLV